MSYILFKVNMFKEYKLRLTMQNIITLEATFNKDFYSIVMEFISGTVPLESLLQILKQSMMAYGYVSCDNDVYNIYDEYLEEGHSMQDLYILIFKIIEHAGFFDDSKKAEENEANTESTYPKNGDNPTSADRCFFDLRDKAVECEMDEDRFWNSTYGEVLRYVIAYNNKLKNDIKMSLRASHLTADLVGISVARLLDSDVKLPDITEMYPDLFGEELKLLEEHKEIARLNKLKENFANLAKICVPSDNNNKKGD